MKDTLEVTATQKPSVEVIQQELARQQALVLEHCKLVIEHALLQHRCELVGLPQIAPDGRVVAAVTIQLKRT